MRKPSARHVRRETERRLARAAQHLADAERWGAEAARIRATIVEVVTPVARIEPADLSAAGNPLRPTSLADMVGQERLKPLLRRLIDNSKISARPLDHVLLVGAAGTGKSTVAQIIARELGRNCYVLKAPVDMDTLMALRESAQDGDIAFVDETHLWTKGDRRGRGEAPDPESVLTLLEDGTLMTSRGLLTFPQLCWIGATTDVGLLPEPLSSRFPLQPRLAPYTYDEMTTIAQRNARSLGLVLAPGVAELFAKASRLNPRQINSYMRSANALASAGAVDLELAREVIEDLNGVTLDGYTPSMQAVLKFLYQCCRRETRNGVTYSASARALATAAGHGRDTAAIDLLVQPWLLQQGLLRVEPGGRTLTDAGIQRAKAL